MEFGIYLKLSNQSINLAAHVPGYTSLSPHIVKKTEYFASLSSATDSFLPRSLFLFTQTAKNSSAQLSSALAEDWFCEAVENKGQGGCMPCIFVITPSQAVRHPMSVVVPELLINACKCVNIEGLQNARLLA